MSCTEFARNAGRWRDLIDADRTEAIASACRGSGNPAVLAWLAEALELDDESRVVDIGGGLGGPCAWLADRYHCRAVSMEPLLDGCRCARTVFALPAVAANGEALPFRSASFDVALLLGVLSVVPDRVGVLREAARISDRLGLIVYCATGPAAVDVGGSHFPSRSALHSELRRGGWRLLAGPTAPALPPPPQWTDDHPTPEDPDETNVGHAIARGRIEPLVAAAERA